MSLLSRVFRRRASRSIEPGVTVGPSPWYLEGRSLQVEGRRFVWKGSEPPLPSATVLAGDGGVVMALAMYAYVRRLPEDRLLTWFPEPKPRRERPTTLHLVLGDLHGLKPLADVQAAATAVSEGKAGVVGVDVLSTLELPLDLRPGIHPKQYPEWLATESELLLLVQTASIDEAGTSCRVWSLRPRLGELEVVPQDWFNHGDFDFGYEWITRIGRDDQGRLVGDGIRLRPFRLDASGRQLDKWLRRSQMRG